MNAEHYSSNQDRHDSLRLTSLAQEFEVSGITFTWVKMYIFSFEDPSCYLVEILVVLRKRIFPHPPVGHDGPRDGWTRETELEKVNNKEKWMGEFIDLRILNRCLEVCTRIITEKKTHNHHHHRVPLSKALKPLPAPPVLHCDSPLLPDVVEANYQQNGLNAAKQFPQWDQWRNLTLCRMPL